MSTTRPSTGDARTGRATQEPAAQNANELPSREALTARLEAQRAELLRAMSRVNLARRTIEQHVVRPLPSEAQSHQLYRQRVLQALADAAEALGSAYPMLEGIAQALNVEEILKGLTPEPEAQPSSQAAAASSRRERSRAQPSRRASRA